MDPAAMDPGDAGVPPGFTPPKLDFSKLKRRESR
jgi:hypothetical protein